MKKIIIVLLLLLVAFSLNAESLNEYALWAKEASLEIYNSITAYAIYTWGDNPALVITEINFQCYYLYSCLFILNDNPEPEIRELIISYLSIITNDGLPIDWKWVYDDVIFLQENL